MQTYIAEETAKEVECGGLAREALGNEKRWGRKLFFIVNKIFSLRDFLSYVHIFWD